MHEFKYAKNKYTMLFAQSVLFLTSDWENLIFLSLAPAEADSEGNLFILQTSKQTHKKNVKIHQANVCYSTLRSLQKSPLLDFESQEEKCAGATSIRGSKKRM